MGAPLVGGGDRLAPLGAQVWGTSVLLEMDTAHCPLLASRLSVQSRSQTRSQCHITVCHCSQHTVETSFLASEVLYGLVPAHLTDDAPPPPRQYCSYTGLLCTNLLSSFLPLGLCICCFFRLECFSPAFHMVGAFSFSGVSPNITSSSGTFPVHAPCRPSRSHVVSFTSFTAPTAPLMILRALYSVSVSN